MSTRVRIEVADHVAVVTLDRPDKHNALDAAMFAAIVDAAAEVGAHPGVRAVVLHGAGPSFCSGLDVASLMDDPAALTGLLRRADGERANRAQRVALDWAALPMPVIAAVHGTCFGGGLQIALGADVRIVAPDARLSVREVRWGLVPDMGITTTLPRLLRADVAKELTFTGAVVSGADAARLGLATRTADDPLAAALALAREIAGRSPDAVRAAKRLYDVAWPAGDALALETELQQALLGSPNQLEAVAAGLDQRPPAFVDS
jgi:enoyl-CoA hydratase/carnithine racemase